MPDLNPRAVAGGNTDTIDYAQEESDRLQRDYAQLALNVEELETKAAEIPLPIVGDDTKAVVVETIKQIRDAKTRVEALHGLEKQPHLRRGQGVDQFFFGLWGRLTKRAKNDRDGIADVLGRELTDYDVRVLAAETERRRKAAEDAARIAAAAEAERIQREREAEEARLAVERARKPDTTAAKVEIASQKDDAAAAARIEETVAANRAEDAYVETLARPADIMRTRTAGGTLSTMQEEAYAEIEKQELLDRNKLWPYIALAEKQKALNAWAKSTGHNEQMAGAKIGRRPKSRVR